MKNPMDSQNSSHHPLISNGLPTTLQAQINGLNNGNSTNTPLLSTLQQLSTLSNANLGSQMAFNQLGNDLSSLPWTGQSWIDSAKMAAMYNILQTASMNEQQMNTINAMNSLEQSIKLFSQQANAAAQPTPSAMEQLAASAQTTLHNQLAMETMLQQQQQDPLSTLLQTTSAMDIQPQSSQLSSSLQTASGMPTAHVQHPPAGQSGCNRSHGHLPPSTSAAPPAFPPINPTADPKMAPFEEFDLNDLHDIIFEKGTCAREQPPTSSATSTARAAETSCSIFPSTSSSSSQQPPLPTSSLPNPSTSTSRSMNLPQPDPELERFVSNLNHADLDFEFGANRGGFDTLKFFNEMGGAEVHESPEGEAVEQVELEPVQFTPPDSPEPTKKAHSLALGSNSAVEASPSDSPSTSLKLGGTNQEAAFPNGISLLSPASSSTHHSNPSSSKSMPLVFVSSTPSASSETPAPQLPKAPVEKSAERRSSLLQKANKIPIYKQKFVNLTAQAAEPKGEDCYSFVDDEFETPKPPSSAAVADGREAEASGKSNGHEKSTTTASSSRRPVVRDPHESLGTRPNAGPAWSEDFVARLEADEHSWVRVNPFQTTEIDVRETPEWCRWESERRKPSLRVIVKEELPASTSTKETEDPPRPRLVLKFIKPVEPLPAVQSPADELEDPFGANGHRLKRKKHHKKRDRDKEWEYPGESKRARKEKKHHRHHHGHRRHSGDHCKPVLNGEQHVYPTRLSTAVKHEPTELAGDHFNEPSTSYSSAHVKQEPTATNCRPCAPPPTPTAPILNGATWDPSFTRRYFSFAQTTNDLPKGTFVLAKEEAWKTDCDLWRIDSQNLLQKFVPCDENPGCFRNCPSYTGWCDEIAGNYVVVHVEFLKQTRAETIVRPLYPIGTVLPAVTSEDAAISCEADCPSTPQRAEESTHEHEEQFASTIDAVCEVLLRSCVERHHLEEVLEQPDSKQCRAIRLFNERCLAAKRGVHLERELRRDITMLLVYYTMLIEIPTSEEDADGQECLVCGTNEHTRPWGLHSGLRYERSNLRTIVADASFANSMTLHSCDPCSQQLRSYHSAEHGFFLLHKACDDYILDLALERPTASGKLLLGLAMRSFEPLRSMSDRILQLWIDYASVQTEDG